MTYEIIHISSEDLVRSYVGKYKDFRLLSLQVAPEAFASNYSTEAAFLEEVWYERLANPNAATYFAIENSKIIGTVSMLGPLIYGPEDMTVLGNPWQVIGDKTSSEQAMGHYRMNGVFTLPDVRGQGIGKALIEAALQYAGGEAAVQGKAFVCSVVVESENSEARRLYERCDFVAMKEVPNGDTVVILMTTPG
ncbi:putative gnat family protein [Botrytis fragariae]|uniref:Putative gnat family protein n=1 Tax=Botrytis fragariae TaxID=1964551 RepID=A0A8H6AMG1_9HELO|nr:putative gnat family protein [Botrytis fragariae]KAF5870099.1 putative gnat family protein [Botrytis fragariae]